MSRVTPPTGSSVPDTPNVNFTYDNLGNRTQMTDGVGTQIYVYNSLSQLTSETRQFSDSLANAPLPNNGYKIEYTYNLSGGLKSYKDPFGKQVDQAYDKVGRVTGVTGSAYGDNTTGEYASGIQYRAFGQVKQMTLETDDDNVVTVNYDNRMRVSEHKVSSPIPSGGYAQKATFNYTADSRTDVMDNQVDNKFDRTFKYDFAGRLTANNFGNATEGVPYTQTLAYDNFSLLTNRSITHWGQPGGFGATYVNGRKQAAGSSTPSYDAAGNMLSSGLASGGLGQTMTFDAAGRQKSVSTVSRHRVGIVAMASFENVITQVFDGDGHPLKEENAHRRLNMTPPQQLVPENKYQIWSSVLNLAVTELNNTGAKKTTKVMAGGAVIAEQTLLFGNQVIWKSADPLTGSNIQISQNGAIGDREEIEPLGQQVLPVQPFEEMETAPSVSLQGADEPEGLCAAMPKLGVSFQNLPSVCRDIAIRNGTATFEDLHHGPMSSPTKIPNGVDSLMHSSPTIDARKDSAMSYALAATAKPIKGKDNDCPPGEKCVVLDSCKLGTPGCLDIRETTIDGKPAIRAGSPLDSVDVRYQPDLLDRIDASTSSVDDFPSISPRPLEPYPPAIPPTPKVPCGATGVTLSAFGGVAWGASEIAGTGGVVAAVDHNPYNQTYFDAPYGGIVFGGSSQPGTGYPSRRGWGFGAAISAGPSLFLSNQSKPDDQTGVFDTNIIATPLVTVQIDNSLDRKTTNFSIGGPSFGAGIFNFRTKTAKPRETMLNLPGGCPQGPIKLM
jgi:YD repeat-containing protein